MNDLPTIWLASIWPMSLLDVMSPLALMSCMYVFGACLCRLGGMDAKARRAWVHLYVCVFAIAALSATEILHGHATELLCFICICLGFYIYATASAWENGTPSIARIKE